ncbi:hypothetical protein [Marinoscillum sp. MHG1-6]|uniref:hypothetical protein n=1 Tax=Marinoscillum sp. MHG1-6 TaxID=2959627 RepID=UPI002157E6EF|nr:hypothetical protein [Marinoscillum sp. MHG1-6]
MSTEIIGYIALGLGLLAISMKEMMILRIFHALSALAYLIYGATIGAHPVMLAGVLFICIHGYHIFQLIKKRQTQG